MPLGKTAGLPTKRQSRAALPHYCSQRQETASRCPSRQMPPTTHATPRTPPIRLPARVARRRSTAEPARHAESDRSGGRWVRQRPRTARLEATAGLVHSSTASHWRRERLRVKRVARLSRHAAVRTGSDETSGSPRPRRTPGSAACHCQRRTKEDRWLRFLSPGLLQPRSYRVPSTRRQSRRLDSAGGDRHAAREVGSRKVAAFAGASVKAATGRRGRTSGEAATTDPAPLLQTL